MTSPLHNPSRPTDAADSPAVLFIFDDAIAESRNLRHAFHQPTKQADNPQLSPDRPYEDQRLQVWGSLLRWKNGWRQLGNTFGASAQAMIFALDSDDGRHWYRADLGLHDIDGSRQNSVLFPPDADGSWRFLPSLIEHPAPPDERWRYLLYTWLKPGGKSRAERAGLHLHRSADGLHFEPVTTEPILTPGDYGPMKSNDVVAVYYDAQAKCFTLYAAVMIPQEPAQRVAWDNCPHLSRQLAQWKSDDGIHWTDQRMMLTPDRHEPAWQQYYGVTVSPYEGLWTGFPLYYHVREQFMQPHAIYSRDRLNWERLSRQPFLPCGDSPDRWDFGAIMLSWDFVRLDDQLVFVYSGSSAREHTNRAIFRMGTATLRLDGFASVSPGGAEALDAELTTVPFPAAAGKRLLLNTMPDYHKDAWLEVEALTADGKPIEGYTFADAGRIAGDDVRLPISWGGRATLPHDRGPIRLRIRLHQQRLFALRFGK